MSSPIYGGLVHASGLGDVAALTDGERVKASVASAIERLPKGYDTLLSRLFRDEDGQEAMLSAGQWQRVAWARSLMRRNAEVVILDEPTASLDPSAATYLDSVLSSREDGRTVIVISHRLSALRTTNLIVVFGNGRVIEEGSHDSLMRRGGRYATLFLEQAAPYQLRLTAAADRVHR